MKAEIIAKECDFHRWVIFLKDKKKSFAEAKDYFFLAGAERLELPTPGFGDRCSTN